MKKFLLLAGLLAGGFLTGRAQSQADSPPKLRELGFGTNLILTPVFNKESVPLDFVYKWGNSQRLYRLGASLAYSDRMGYYNSLRSSYKTKEIVAELFIGKEWRQQLSERWLLNYGGDINFHYYHQSNEWESQYYPEERTYHSLTKNNTHGAGIRPFVGGIFALKPRLLIGVEASFQVGVQRFFEERKYYTEEDGRLNKEDYSFNDEAGDGWNLHFRTQPASNIFVYYRF